MASRSTARLLADELGQLIPELLGFHARVAAPPVSVCSSHQAPAAQACSCCGHSLCGQRVVLERIHCAACFGRLEVAAQRRPRPYPYAALRLFFGSLFGVDGLLAGTLAGLGPTTRARRTNGRWLRLLVALNAYAAAAELLAALQWNVSEVLR